MSTAAPHPGIAVHGTVRLGPRTLRLDVEAAPGETVAVVGPSGVGKTTLLRVVAGLQPLTQGRVELAGRLVDDGRGVHLAPHRRGVGVAFQDYRLFPHLSVLANVAFPLRSRGLGARAARAAAREELDRLGIGNLAARRPGQLSGGQAQRVSLARALVGSPVALLLDEPTAALDAATRDGVLAELRRHLAGFARPCLLVTHDPQEVNALVSREIRLQDAVQGSSPIS